MKIVNKREEIVKAVRENATVFLDCTKEEDRKVRSDYSFACLAFGKYRTLNRVVVYRDTYHMDNKRNTVCHTEVCGISAHLSFEDLKLASERNTLKVVNAGDTVTIVCNLRSHMAVMTVGIKDVTTEGEAILSREDAKEISDTIFFGIDHGM